ncbi:MAG: thiamine phosphate synthase [Pirellulales bacterium]
MERTVFRILDAAANRAGEGLRVIEDYLRFALDDGHLTGVCKQLRHDLTAALSALAATDRHAARDTQADVGAPGAPAGDSLRIDATAVVAASFKRVEQALRSLEEYGKLIDTSLGTAFEQLRYRTYTLERATDLTRASLERLADARLYVLLDGRSSLEAFTSLVSSLIEARVDVVQLRDKRLKDRQLIERARRLHELTRSTETLAIVNDRPDIARLAGADGVHVGQEELCVKDGRTIVGPQSLVGVSTHTIEQAQTAVMDGANYIGVGPTFASTTKAFNSLAGLDLLSAVAAEIRLPAFAIGGITLENVGDVLAAGFTRVAVGASIAEASDPAEVAREFIRRLAL